MKINVSRQSVYLLALSIFLLIFVFVFSFAILIPEGKEYRKQRMQLRKESIELREYNDFRDETFHMLKNLQSENRHIIMAFDNTFKVEKFQQKYKEYFSALKLTKLSKIKDENDFSLYEVNSTSKIDSPVSFYNFLEALNKSNWIISIEFPINFTRENDLISSSFTMKVHKINKMVKPKE